MQLSQLASFIAFSSEPASLALIGTAISTGHGVLRRKLWWCSATVPSLTHVMTRLQHSHFWNSHHLRNLQTVLFPCKSLQSAIDSFRGRQTVHGVGGSGFAILS
jgi:hypothetical protein